MPADFLSSFAVNQSIYFLFTRTLPPAPSSPPQAAPLGPLSKGTSPAGRLLCAMTMASIAGNRTACTALLEDPLLAKAASEAVAKASRDEDVSVSSGVGKCGKCEGNI